MPARFHGWVDETQRAALFGGSGVLALPSTWPEPFGLVGLEAAAHGMPAIAFDVGGVREWLVPGVRVSLPFAPANDRRLRCVRSSARWEGQRIGASSARGPTGTPPTFHPLHTWTRLRDASTQFGREIALEAASSALRRWN